MLNLGFDKKLIIGSCASIILIKRLQQRHRLQ